MLLVCYTNQFLMTHQFMHLLYNLHYFNMQLKTKSSIFISLEKKKEMGYIQEVLLYKINVNRIFFLLTKKFTLIQNAPDFIKLKCSKSMLYIYILKSLIKYNLVYLKYGNVYVTGKMN